MSDISSAAQFHLAEYETLRHELEFFNGEMYNATLYAIISTGAIWAWLAINHEKVRGIKFVWWLPFTVSIVADLWIVLVCRHMVRIDGYLRQIEAVMPRLPGLEGWHTSLHHDPEWWRLSAWAFWCSLFVTTGLMPFFFLRRLEKHRATTAAAEHGDCSARRPDT